MPALLPYLLPSAAPWGFVSFTLTVDPAPSGRYVGWKVPVRRVETAGAPLSGSLPIADQPLPLSNTLAFRVGPVTALDTMTGLEGPVGGLDVRSHLAATPEGDAPIGALAATAVELPGQPGVWVVSWSGAAIDAALAERVDQLVYAVVGVPGEWRVVLPLRVTASQRAVF